MKKIEMELIPLYTPYNEINPLKPRELVKMLATLSPENTLMAEYYPQESHLLPLILSVLTAQPSEPSFVWAKLPCFSSSWVSITMF